MRRGSPRGVGIGIDVGGTFTKIVAMSGDGALLGEIQVETLPGLGPAAFVRRVSDAARGMERSLGSRACALGLGLAGEMDARRGALRSAPNLKPFVGFGFKAAFQARLGLYTAADNDANMAAWGVYVLELGRRYPDVVCITLGTGIGGGLVLGGELYRGPWGVAGEIGHICVEPDGELCRCGSRGCLEAYASAYGILRLVRKMTRLPGRRSALRRLCSDPRSLDVRAVALAARQGDPAARAALAVAGRYLGIGIANLGYILTPHVVVLAGGVSGSGSLILDPALRVLRSKPFQGPLRHVRIRIARIPHLGARGAALLALGLKQCRR